MKHSNEIQTVLAAIFVLNRTSKHANADISLILDYAFRRLFGVNTNLLILACLGKRKDQIMSEVMQTLKATTQYEKYSEDYH